METCRSKGRQLKKQRRRKTSNGRRQIPPIGPALPLPMPTPEPPREWAWKRWASAFTALVGVLGVLHYLPSITVKATADADPANPLSAVFELTNEQVYDLNDLGIEVSLRCGRIGHGTNTDSMDCKRPSMRSDNQRWSQHDLGAHRSYEFTPGDRLFITPGAMLYAQISIYVSFKPWLMPFWWPEQEYRFETRVRSDGKVDWLKIPNT